jgi:hypothetical protein
MRDIKQNTVNWIFILKNFLFCIGLFLSLNAFSQLNETDNIYSNSIKNGTVDKKKKLLLGTVQLGLWGGSFYSLNKAWYANYPRTKFHRYNDWKEWEHMDKAGHAWSTYQISEQTSKLWQWAGADKKKGVVIGSISGMAYLSIIEILDGYSDKWGFSIPDVMANTSGAALYLGQEMLWNEQRIRIKLSYHPVKYGELNGRANDLFGSGKIEKLLKDYNGQTYWASINVKSFFPESRFPNWLNLALGYGAERMLGGYVNSWKDLSGTIYNRTDIQRYKKLLFSLDVDLTKVNTKNKTLKTVFSLVNVLKVPAPAISINTNGKSSFYGLYF